MVKREFLSKIGIDDIAELNKIIKKLDRLNKYKILSKDRRDRLDETINYIKGLSHELPAQSETSFEDWIDRMGGEIRYFDPTRLENVMDNYFEGSGAFRRPKSREDFPDAFILGTIYDIIEELDDGEILNVSLRIAPSNNALRV